MDATVIGVRFQEAGKIYYFEPGGYDDLGVGEYVVVETSRGVELGRVVIAPGQVLSAELTEPLKPILRPGTPDDIDRAADLREQAREVTELARARARALNLPMKVVNAQYTLDSQRLTVYFTAEGRVDFRDLTRDLAGKIRAQVQLRQVGPRDQAKVIGGYGRCGRRLCCTSWLTTFPAISIKMAKEQSLPLNPSKISGQCGRLLCCLSYENDLYKKLKSELPRPDAMVTTPAGAARVVAVNAIKQIVTLEMIDGRQVIEATVEQLGFSRGVTRVLPDGDGAEGEDEVVVVTHEEVSITSFSVVRDVPRGPGSGRNARSGQAAPPQRDGQRRASAVVPVPARPATAPAQARPPQPAPAERGDLPTTASSDEGTRKKRRRRRHRGGGGSADGPSEG